jgi:hypothetical protein
VFYDTARYVDQGGGKRKGSLLFISKLACRYFDFDLKRIQEKRKCVQEIYSSHVDFRFIHENVQEDGNDVDVSQRMSWADVYGDFQHCTKMKS